MEKEPWEIEIRYGELEIEDLEDLIDLIRIQREQARLEGVEATLKLIDDYFAGLIVIPEPQKTHKNIDIFIRSKLLK